jgi:hypothetical protein
MGSSGNEIDMNEESPIVSTPMVFTLPVLERLVSWGGDVDWFHEIRDKALARSELI